MTATGELLIEFLSEEIPARMQSNAAREMKELIDNKLKAQGLSFSHLETYITPRRLAIRADEVPLHQQERTEEKRGPRIDAPERAIQGFLQSLGLKSLKECQQRDTGKGVFWFAEHKIPGRDTAEILPQLINELFSELTWPKAMRWGSNTRTWVRPLHSIVCLHAGKKVSGQLSLGDHQITFTNLTQGHRFMAPSSFEISCFEDYQAMLYDAYVVIDPRARREKIYHSSQALAAQHGLSVKRDEGLLEEVTGLVEWPVPLLGTIDKEFMALPPEVLITSMRVHQKYFATENHSGSLAPYFIVVANIETHDQGKTIIAGNKKVLRARLSDAAFFYEQDRKKTLTEHAQGLKKAVFHGQLGTLAEKSERLANLAGKIARLLDFSTERAQRAGQLCKADLMTSMVGEFPELQGIMGYYYALNDSEHEEIASAIYEHYQPRGPSDNLPQSTLGQIVALADKIDTLVGFFAVNIKPTGSKDPYALRRAALGCIRLLENFPALTLEELIEKAYASYLPVLKETALTYAETLQELRSFFLDRLIVYWREQSLPHDYIKAVFAVEKELSVALLFKRIKALEAFMKREDNFGADLLVAYRRACNIIAIEEKKDGLSYSSAPHLPLLVEPAEQKLYAALQNSLEIVFNFLKNHDFVQAMSKIAELKPVIDGFFDAVTVNVEDKNIRANRLQLLSLIRTALHQVADFSKIEG